VSLVPQLAHLKATASAGAPIVADHWASLMMKDKEPQLWQAKPLFAITWRRHRGPSPEGYIPAACPLATILKVAYRLRCVQCDVGQGDQAALKHFPDRG
jgi:hypothetical protein